MDDKIIAVNEACRKIGYLNNNEFDTYLKSIYSNLYFGNRTLYDVYSNNEFDTYCGMASVVCSVNLPFKCELVRAYLVPHVKGNKFFHAFIEAEYKGKKYVIDTSLGRSIPKEIYYEYLKPKVYKRIDRDKLFVNKFVTFIKDTLTRPNNLSISFIYNIWCKYESKKLKNINDNSILEDDMLKEPEYTKK